LKAEASLYIIIRIALLITECLPRTALAAYGSDWKPRDSFILDTGAKVHICYDKSRFKTYNDAPQTVLTGGGDVRIDGYADVDIVVQHSDGECTITPRNVLNNPDFPGNIVSLKLANKAGISWGQANNRLIQGQLTWCLV
jgi:hypothetical protein